MLYDEFLEGTGCKDTPHNYGVYKDLEILYMNSEKTKQEIYEYGKKLVDNSLTEKQIAWNDDVDADIARLQEQLEAYKQDVRIEEENYRYWIDYDKEYAKSCRRRAKYAKEQCTILRNKIRNLKSCKYV